MMEYIKIEAKSDDCADPNPYPREELPLTKEELRRQYYPFFEKPIIRRIEEVK